MPQVCGLSDCSNIATNRCAKCKLIYYCCKDHQRAAWKWHKKLCKEIAATEGGIKEGSAEYEDTQATIVPVQNITREVHTLEPDFPVKIVELEGRGLGMMATRKIKRGELVLQERPVIDTSIRVRASDVELTEDDLSTAHIIGVPVSHDVVLSKVRAVRYGYDRLTEEEKRKVMDLHDSHQWQTNGKKTLNGVYQTNSFNRSSCSQDSQRSTDGVLCLLMSRFNHSCTPNACQFWSPPYERMVADHDIEEGEEVCTGYVDMLAYKPRSKRQEELKRNYGFECCCRTCAVDAESEHQASDSRRIRLGQLSGHLDGVGEIRRTGVQNPWKGLQLVDECLETLQEERLDNPFLVGVVSYEAYQLACLIGDMVLAKKWIKEAHKSALICEGPGSDWEQKMAKYVKNPRDGWGSGWGSGLRRTGMDYSIDGGLGEASSGTDRDQLMRMMQMLGFAGSTRSHWS